MQWKSGALSLAEGLEGLLLGDSFRGEPALGGRDLRDGLIFMNQAPPCQARHLLPGGRSLLSLALLHLASCSGTQQPCPHFHPEAGYVRETQSGLDSRG